MVLLKQIVGFVTVRQTNIYSNLTDYQRTNGPVKTSLLVLSRTDKQTFTETIKHVQSPHWLHEDQWPCKSNIVGFVTVRQSNMYRHLTEYKRTTGLVKTTLLVLSMWDNQKSTVTSLITSGSAVLQKKLCRFCYDETIKHLQSPHWLPEDLWSFKINIVGFVTVGQSNMYSHLTDYQRISGPVKTTFLVII